MASNPQQGTSNKQNANDQKKNKYHYKKNEKPNNANNNNAPQRNPNNDSDKILKDLLSNLECVICLEFLQAPIFMCERGHNLCGSCRENLHIPICQMCKGSLTNQRNFTLENICSKMSQPCPNAAYGCTFVTAPDNIKTHFEECAYRQYFCPLGRVKGTCSWAGNYNKIAEHFTEKHSSNTILKVGIQIMFPDFDVYKPDSDIQLIKVGSKLFIYHVKMDVEKNVAFWAIQYIGSENEARNWKYEFVFYNSKKTRKIMNISEECSTDNTDIEKIFQSGNCVAIPLFVLKNYVHDNKKFTLKCFIRSTVPRVTEGIAAIKIK